MTDLANLVDVIRKMRETEFPTIRSIEVSPGVFDRLKRSTPHLVAANRDPLALQVSARPVLDDHMAAVRFSDGRLGYWDIRQDEIRIIESAQSLLAERYKPGRWS